MGGLVSSPVDESTKKEIEDAIKDLLGTFTKEYVKYYAIGLVQKIKEEAQAEPDGYKLLVREESKDNRKVGTVLKEGGVLKKAFNQRYFVVKHDWMIDYYASEEDSKKEKAKPRATISLCGYHVNPDANDTVINRLKKLAEKMGMNFDELPKPKEYPKGTIELHHSRRQSYYITIENDEERKQWVETFQDACRYAYGLKNKDRVHKFAFNEAVRRTRWHTGAWGWWSWGGTEEQILSDLISDYIDWKIMYKIYGKITGPWMIRNTVRNQVLKVLDKTILAAVTPAWKAMATTVEALRPKIEPVIKENLSPLFKLQKELQDKMKDGAMSIINPILSEHVTPHLSKIVEVIKSPMVEAFDVNFKQYEEQINKYDFKGGKEDAQKGFHELNYFPRSWHMWKAFDKVDPMYDPLWALHIVFEDIYPWSLIWTARDTLREKMDNAMYTFEVKLIEELEKGEQKDSRALIDFVKAKVMADYQDDAKLATINYYREIIKAIVMPPFQKKVFPACEAILAPIGDLIPEPFKQFCDPGQMFTEVLQGIIDESINNVLGAN